MPVILVLLGLALLQIVYIKNSPPLYLNTLAFPGPQRVLFNKDVVSTTPGEVDYSPQDLAGNLPDASYFAVTYDTTSNSYASFYEQVNATQFVGETEPYRFGSY